MPGPTSVRRRLPTYVLGGALGVASLLAALTTGSASAFLASVTNSSNSANNGTLVLREANANGQVTCTSSAGSGNAATCSTIDKYGGVLTLAPGDTTATTVNFTNSGTLPAGLTMQGGSCAQSTSGGNPGGASDMCTRVTIVITKGTTTLFSGTAATLAAASSPVSVGPLTGGASVSLTFTVGLDPKASASYTSLKATQPITWTLS